MNYKMIKKRNKAIQHEWKEALSYVGDIGDIVDSDIFDTQAYYDNHDTQDMEKLIHFLSTEETSVVLLCYLGYKGKEIVTILGLKNIAEYYNINRQIKMHTYLFNILNKHKQALSLV